MGQRGPQRTPTQILRLTGSTAIRKPGRDGSREPQPEIGVPDPPSWLSDYAREEWDLIVDALVHTGVIATHEATILAVYCEAIGEYRKIGDAIARDGLTVGNAGSQRPHPLTASRRRAAEDALKFARELGLTPAARSRVQAIEAPSEPTGKSRFFAAERAAHR